LGAQEKRVIVRSPRPQDFETPLEYLDSYLTPNDVFFVRSHFGPPVIDPKQWRLEFDGLLRTPQVMTLGDLRKFAIVSLPATLQCAGNGRAWYKPPVPGAQWQYGGVGNAEWRGVRLGDVLRAMQPLPSAHHVQCEGYDLPPMPTVPAFKRSISLDRAVAENTVLAFEMNGEPLPVVHGGPLRLVVPGWAGENWTKWLRRITLQEHEASGFYMEAGYRVPGESGSGTIPASVLPVKSLIARPGENSSLPLAPVTIAGVAFTGTGSVTKLEVSTDGASWIKADLEPQKSAGAWQLWRYLWKPAAGGKYVITARATDSEGAVQPDATPWNKGGYLWNGIQRVTCEIR
jgi:DMSO/TMAO reductase YedYZ molybdopterin-dependent catalytic subunit